MTTKLVTFATTGTDGDPVSTAEEFVVCDGVVDLCLKDMEEAFLAQLLPRLGSLEDGSDGLAQVTWVLQGLLCWRCRWC